MSLKKQLAHNTAAQLVGKIVSTILGLLAIGMMTRYLGVEQFGWYATTLAFLQFIAIMIDFGLIPVTAQMMSEVPSDIKDEDAKGIAAYRSKLMKNLLGFRFTTAVLGLGFAPLIALFFPYPHEVKIAITFTTISMLGVAMNQIFIGFYQSKLSTYLQAIGEVVGRIALVVGLFLCVYLDFGFLPVMWAIVLSSVVYTAVMWLYAKRSISVSFAFDFEMWKKIATRMWPIAISIMFNVIYLRGDTIILSIFREQAEVGFYRVAYSVIDIVAQTAMMVMGLMLPLLAYTWSKGDGTKFKEHFQLAFNVMMMFAIPMAVGLVVLSENIVILVAGEEYSSAALPLSLLSIAVFGIFVGAVFGHVAVAVNRQKQTLPVYIATALIALVLYFIFIPRFGMNGAAIVSIFSELFAGTLLYIIVKKYSKISLSWVTLGKALCAGGLMAGVLFFMRPVLETFGSGAMYAFVLFLVILSSGAMYAFVLFATKAVSLETLKEVTSLKKTT
ncbi:MAG: flippase [Candidatus Magasanikbacteria bacterium]|nr:flippase [Candidatus Magasanikbacteria bacterium]